MDMEFVVKDAYTLVRPQWALVTTLEEAGTLFAEAVRANYKTFAADKATEAAEADTPDDDEDEADLDGRTSPVEGGDKSSEDEVNSIWTKTRPK